MARVLERDESRARGARCSSSRNSGSVIGWCNDACSFGSCAFLGESTGTRRVMSAWRVHAFLDRARSWSEYWDR